MSSSAKDHNSVDWCAHRENYIENHAPLGVSARKFFEEQNLNPNTGRRQFTAIAKLEQEGLTYVEINKRLFSKVSGSARAPLKSGSSGSTKSGSSGSTASGSTKKKPAAKPKVIKNNELKEGKGKSVPPASKTRSKTQIRLTTPLQMDFIDKSSDAQIGNGGRFTKGNTAGVKNGAYMNLVHAQSDIIDVVLNSRLGDVSEIIKLSEIRYIQMERLLVDRLVRIEVMAESGTLPLDHDNKPIPKEDLIREAMWSSSGTMTNLLGTLTMSHTQAFKAQVENTIKLERLEREKADREFMQAVAERRHRDEITALEAAQLIESRGLTPSPLMTAEALKEIELMKPKEDLDGVSDKDLDALVAEYVNELKESNSEMYSRRGVLEQMMLESKAILESGGLEESDFADGAYTGLDHDDDEVSDSLDVEFNGVDDWNDE